MSWATEGFSARTAMALDSLAFICPLRLRDQAVGGPSPTYSFNSALGVWCIPMREWIAFAQRLKKRPAITAQQVCQKVVHPCDCVFVEQLDRKSTRLNSSH